MSDHMLPVGVGVSKAKLSMAVPTAELRYLNDVLQQLWNITETEGGYPIRGRTEWRDVPAVQGHP